MDSAVTGVNSALQKYEESVGLAYSDLPLEKCDGTTLELSKWSLVITDNSLSNIATITKNRVQAALDAPPEKKKYKSLEEELAELSSLSMMDEEEEVVQLKPMSKRKTRLERTLEESTGGPSGPSFEEQNLEEETYRLQEEANKKVKWSNMMKKKGLLSLNIAGAEQVTDYGVKCISDVCISLRSISLEGCYKVTDVGLRALAMGCIYLRSLNLSGCLGMAGVGFATIGECCSELTELKLSGCRQIPTWVFLKVFEGCRKLEVLDVSYCTKIGDGEIKSLAEKCNVLRSVNLKECKQVSDVGILAVSQGCTGLEELDLSRSELQFKITDVSLLALSERSEILNKLNLNGCEMVTDAGLSWLAKGCSGLKWLDLMNCSKVSNGGMRCLGEGCPDLEWCNLSHLKKVTDVGLRFLAQGCSKLKSLNATGIFLLSDGMKRDFGFEGLQALGRSPCAKTLKTLNLTGCFQVSTTALKSLSMLTAVENLCLSGCVNLTTQGMGYMADGLDKVRTLSLAFCGDCVSDAMMTRCLKKWTKITSAIFTECEKIGQGSLKALAGCTNLRRLDLTGCHGVDDLALLPLSEATFWPGISALYLTGCVNVGDTGLAWIADGMKNSVNETTLVTLSLKGTRCSNAALKAVKDRYRYSDMRNNESFFGLWPHSRATDRMVINDYGLLYRSATKIQSLYRARKDRQKTGVKKVQHCRTKATLLCQKRWRGRKGREKAMQMRDEQQFKHDAAHVIQNMYQAWKGRKWLRARRNKKWLNGANGSATLIQKRWRGCMGRSKFESTRKQRLYILELQSRASVEIQKICRSHLAKLEHKRRADNKIANDRLRFYSTWKIQGSWRQHTARERLKRQRKWVQNRFESRNSSATKIQVRYRAYRCRMILSTMVSDKREQTKAATYVQACWRARLAWLEVETKRQIWLAEQESKAALIMQRAWRRKAAQKLIEAMKAEKKRMERLRESMASLIESWWRGVIARREAAELKKQYLAQLRRMADLENWGATMIAACWRGKGGRDLWRERVWQKKARWKEMWSEEEARKFYYNQISGEIRYRKPQDLLDLMKRPICSNCEFYEARVECSNCTEFFCHQCWDSVHFGGKRSKHLFRNLYDYYEKRVDYGDGEFPSKWPSEIEQDEFAGWKLRVYPARKPYKIIGDWEIYEPEDEGENEGKFFYHNRVKHLSQYEKPDELKVLFTDDWTGEGEVEAEEEGAGEEKKEIEAEKQAEKKTKMKAPAPAEDEEPAEELWEGWGKYWDDESSCYYYFNVDTGESTYDRPGGFETRNDPFLGIRDGGEDMEIEDVM
ncbi:hypothetical protein TrVE_jg986 [Triparma verrucosa]|uniref:Uncharacterized protein n=1 Tax=Triparma verrucosa TaxID=1606542 RepID=A0A9W7ERA7_9STRA|nr:hypothetical protein TrVE_jg986 [Triparma verrucosa]